MNGCERGQVLPLLAVVMVIGGLVCVAAGRLGGAAVARAQAVTAADAAALAGAGAGPRAAARVASANGARVTRYEQVGGDTRVSVEVNRARATARARRSGPSVSASNAPNGPAPALRAALARAGQLVGAPVPIVRPLSGEALPGDAAARHERGLAVDVPASFVPRLLPHARRAGLCQPYPQVHPIHFEVCSVRPPAGHPAPAVLPRAPASGLP